MVFLRAKLQQFICSEIDVDNNLDWLLDTVFVPCLGRTVCEWFSTYYYYFFLVCNNRQETAIQSSDSGFLYFFSEVDRSLFQKKLKSLLKSHHSYPEVIKMSAIYQSILSYGFQQLINVVIILVCRL